jgi:hypothetical protein
LTDFSQTSADFKPGVKRAAASQIMTVQGQKQYVEEMIDCRRSQDERSGDESIAARRQTALDLLLAQAVRRPCGCLALRIAVRVRKKKRSMPARRAEHGEAP